MHLIVIMLEWQALEDLIGAGVSVAAVNSPRSTVVSGDPAALDDLLARKTVAGRPGDLADDLAWVRAASGRWEHADPRGRPSVGAVERLADRLADAPAPAEGAVRVANIGGAALAYLAAAAQGEVAGSGGPARPIG